VTEAATSGRVGVVAPDEGERGAQASSNRKNEGAKRMRRALFSGAIFAATRAQRA
jgi:hypothetical protein